MGQICAMCGGHYNQVSEKALGEMTYVVLKCEKCGHMIAKQK